MTKKDFAKKMENGFLVLDGATGSNLIKRGMPSGVCPEEWILEHPEVLYGLQKEYVQAGSQIVYAPTFTCNRIKLKEFGLESKIKMMNMELVQLSKRAADGKALVAGDLTMTGEQLAPIGKLDFEELVEIYKEQISYIAEAGADLLVIETMMSLQESRAALLAAKETCDLPVMVTMTFEADGRSLFGTDAKTAAIVLESLGADAVGANCSTGPDKMAEVIQSMAEVVSIPIIAKPNAGLPKLAEDGSTIYDMDAITFGREMKQLVLAGASILGGCCGTTPESIKELVENISLLKPVVFEKKVKRYLTSERKTLSFGLDDPFLIVGERINPTGKKKLQAELREGNLEMIDQFAEEQENCGARILDINVGMSGIDEKEMMLKILEEVGGISSLPLAIDSSKAEVIEAALRRYPGRALINSVSQEKAKYENILTLAKKYGAMFVLLPVSDAGLPKNLLEKKQIIHTVLEKALSMGMKKEDVVVDGLVGTVGANPQAAIETMETITYCKKNGLATVCGLSNISFGLPERGFVNAAFVTMAIQAGLTMAILNPSQELLVNSIYAADLLCKKEESDIRYIERMNYLQDRNADTSEKHVNLQKKEADDICHQLKNAVLKGNKNGIVAITKEALAQGYEAKELLNSFLLPGINEVGDLFDKGKYFLPQLIAGAEAMKRSIEYLEPFLLNASEIEEKATVVIATVEGDIHDIGKNLVALMLKNYGFRVIDLGKDVPKEEIIRVAIAEKAQIIGLSALMTTTMQEMRNVIAYAKEHKVNASIVIGGAVITQDYADEIGADGYSKDAADAVKLAQRILEEKNLH